MVQISLGSSSGRDSTGQQSVQRETTCRRSKISKKQGLGFVLVKPRDKLCLGDATALFISPSYLFEKQASKEIWGKWYPLCSMSVVPFIPGEGTESVDISELTERRLIMKHTPILIAVVALSLGMIPAAYGAYGLESQPDPDPFTEQDSNKMDSGSDQESTKMKRNPAKEQTVDHNAQVTIGGARSVVSGEIRKVEDEYYFIKDDETGNEVRLLVNKDANLDCSAAPIATAGATAPSAAKDRQPGEQQAPEASDRQKEQGQKKDQTAVGSGFRIGACSFKPGDRIKAEVDDMGRVTTLKFMRTREEPQTARSLGESAATGVLAIPGQQENPGQLDMTGPHGYPPKDYAVLPVPLGELKSVSDDLLLHSSVMNAEGQVIGSLANLLMDSQTGQIEYAIVLLDDSERLEVVPWAHMKKGQTR
jgi:hypothetical protein